MLRAITSSILAAVLAVSGYASAGTSQLEVADVSGGEFHTLVLMADGSLWEMWEMWDSHLF